MPFETMAEAGSPRVAALAGVGVAACCVLPLVLGGLSVAAGLAVGSGLLVTAGVLGVVLWWQRRTAPEVKEGEVRAH